MLRMVVVKPDEAIQTNHDEERKSNYEEQYHEEGVDYIDRTDAPRKTLETEKENQSE